MKNRIYSFILGLIALTIVMSTYTILNHQQVKSIEQTNRLIALKELTSVTDSMERALNLNLQFVNFYSFLIANDPDISEEYLIEISKRILKEHPSIQNIGLAPDGILSFIYPQQGNELAIGHNLLEDESREPFVTKAIENKTSTTQGPVEAIQGGLLIFNREAIFTKEDGKEKFWGLSAISVDFNKLIKEVGLKPKMNGYLFALRATQLNDIDDFFWGNAEIFQKDALIKHVNLPSQTWEIAIYPTAGWVVNNSSLDAISAFFYILSILAFVATYLLSLNYREKVAASKQDFLTGTFSKAAFLEYFSHKIKNNKKHAVIIIDLNDFKNINDTLGHPVGDGVLIEVANRIEKLLNKHDRVSRFAGDEYLIFLNNIKDNTEVDSVIASISNEVSKPMNIDNNKINIKIAAGGSLFPEDGTSFQELYEISDKRMYKNKEEMKNKV